MSLPEDVEADLTAISAPPFRKSTLDACRALVQRGGIDWAIERTERDLALFGESGQSQLLGLAGDRLDCLRWLKAHDSAGATERRSAVLTDADSLQARIAALPEDNATRSRDYGRGYARAIRDVLDLLEADRYDRGVNA